MVRVFLQINFIQVELKTLSLSMPIGKGCGIMAVELMSQGAWSLLEELSLEGGLKGQMGELLSALQGRSALSRLNISVCGMDAERMRQLVAAMETGRVLPRLQELNLCGNKLGEEGVGVLVGAMRAGIFDHLRMLNVEEVTMGDGGVDALCQALLEPMVCPHLVELKVFDNVGTVELRRLLASRRGVVRFAVDIDRTSDSSDGHGDDDDDEDEEYSFDDGDYADDDEEEEDEEEEDDDDEEEEEEGDSDED